MFDNKTILITGGTGSFGRNFAKHIIANYNPARLIIFSRDELKQFQMKRELDDPRLRFFLGDVRDRERLERAFHGVDIVVHAAALKQVPILEYNPYEAVKTNVFGSQNVIEAAIDQGVDKVLLVSSDKAVQPVNLYGATKLCAEKLFISGNAYSTGKTKLSSVRYGNVLGSRGSIVEILLKNRETPVVELTHEEMTRFWITFEQTFKLVEFALGNMVGGEIFVPKIPSMKIVDLFEAIVPRAERRIVGIRAGEKIHEALLTETESRHTLDLKNYFVILPENGETFDVKTRFAKYLETGRPLDGGFSYRSNNNGQFLTAEELQKLVENLNL
ncbi:MAG: UDP-N-acetylglucosamine 4,6-dehydratase (inverting) [Candidatus Doudnabacteria bacterium]|nr:UDP-N-acetylglucosamine 4,6-dehydratase (inverting) [bacterium]MDZ4244063.1 UDP-N-acetylglucosamine 4,6-dehydratase (inverting) [Candidatus Doudnabacteria bacterium]